MGMTINEALEQLKDYEYYTPYQELISFVSDWIEQSQSNYENRLKADMVAMLTELHREIMEMSTIDICPYAIDNCIDRIEVEILVKDKINKLKEDNKDDKG